MWEEWWQLNIKWRHFQNVFRNCAGPDKSGWKIGLTLDDWPEIIRCLLLCVSELLRCPTVTEYISVSAMYLIAASWSSTFGFWGFSCFLLFFVMVGIFVVRRFLDIVPFFLVEHFQGHCPACSEYLVLVRLAWGTWVSSLAMSTSSWKRSLSKTFWKITNEGETLATTELQLWTCWSYSSWHGKGNWESHNLTYCLVQFIRLKKLVHSQEDPYKKE